MEEVSLSGVTTEMSKERQPKQESIPEKAKRAFWWIVKVGVIAGVSVAALKAVLL